ncbi:MAG: OmpH family outer membrane protein [Marinifilaceae bacterium]|jgi:outer membrane protein|nr:OmpH family outer membrane protein [Marinifilaceae bacterium]
MRRLIQTSILALFLVCGFNSFAQNTKIGHIDSQKLLSLMPEKIEAEKAIQAKALEYDKQIQDMNKEYQEKYVALEKEFATLDEAVKKSRSAELQDLANRIQNFDGFAKKELGNMQTEKFKPIFEKASNAIKAVGKELGLTYVIDISTGAILYNSPESIDLMAKVKVKLGIK